ncbi:hypothetical protein FMEXI_13426 [Fusarium mexicanum]|uniref:Uncharacterized protein n=1 Tax=Fusarium mexicanum TaxID=751941 RepID=A0A8H5I5F8_9HYPO|nr:hypothetical protein FMEXI_13426 [Fusarium mexicanum]
MANSPYIHFPDDYWQVEWRVNGIWNGILTYCFPHGVTEDNWIVAPEVYSTWFNTNGYRADLCVIALETDDDHEYRLSDPIVTYEGKGGNSTKNWQQIGQQILNWCMDGVQNYQPFYCWAIGTKGKFVKFYAFDGVNTLYPLGINAAAKIVKDANVNPQDITGQAGWAFVDQVLTAIRNDPELTAARIANNDFD